MRLPTDLFGSQVRRAGGLEVRYFQRRELAAAIEFAETGGIAVHRNFDRYHGTLSARGIAMERPFLHVIGLRSRLQVWGAGYGLRPEWIQPEKRRRVAHYDLFGEHAERLLERLGVSSEV